MKDRQISRNLVEKLTVFGASPQDPPVLTPEAFAEAAGLTIEEFQAYRARRLGPEHIERLDDSQPLFVELNGQMYYTIWGLSVWSQLRRDGDLT